MFFVPMMDVGFVVPEQQIFTSLEKLRGLRKAVSSTALLSEGGGGSKKSNWTRLIH